MESKIFANENFIALRDKAINELDDGARRVRPELFSVNAALKICAHRGEICPANLSSHQRGDGTLTTEECTGLQLALNEFDSDLAWKVKCGVASLFVFEALDERGEL